MDQLELLRRVVTGLEKLQIAYAIVGSYTSSVWGEPRFTQDIDVLLDLRLEQTTRFCQLFPSEEFYLSEPAVCEAVARRSQFNVIHPMSGNKVDFMLTRATGWNQQLLARTRSESLLPDLRVRFASPEDVMLGKMHYFREGSSDKHLRDCAAILRIQGDAIDFGYVEHWAREAQLLDIWELILRQG